MRKNTQRIQALSSKMLAFMIALSLLMLNACKEDPKPVDTTKPEADFNYTSDELVVTFINASKGAESYAWDFGDGQTSTDEGTTETPIAITYSAAGTYEVSLTATRSNGQTDTKTRQVTVKNTPIASFTSASVGLSVTFTNTSANASDYTWDFGDGSGLSNEASPTHEYSAAGSYTVSLLAKEGALESSTSAEISVIAPIAGFDFEVATLTVTFTNTSENASSYAWDFGDGNTSTEEAPTHTYASSAQYTVTLVATADDTATDEISQDITVAALPQADFSFGGNALAIDFTNTSTDAVSYAWDFGDGNLSTDASPSNSYAQAGVYMVTLIATGSFGDESESRQWVTVAAAGAPYAGFKNGTLDDYGDPSAADYQKNNDDWEKPDFWEGNPDFRAGGMSSDGKKLPDDTKTNGLKMKNNNTRGAYQEVAVENGQSYTVSFDVAGDAVANTNVRLDVYVLGVRIVKEDDAGLASAYEHFEVNDTELTGKGNFISKTVTFTATSDLLTFYMLETIHTKDGDSEVWVDNIVLTKN